jgi:hypothetical protein
MRKSLSAKNVDPTPEISHELGKFRRVGLNTVPTLNDRDLTS